MEATATDYDCPMMYYDYSTDGGKTYSELIPWPDLDIMAGTYPDTFTFSLSFTKGETPVITVRGYNQADLFTESEPITFAKPFVDQEKAAEEARQGKPGCRRGSGFPHIGNPGDRRLRFGDHHG